MKMLTVPIDSFIIEDTGEVVEVGDNCLLYPEGDAFQRLWVAQIDGIFKHSRTGEVTVSCRWYYRPEECYQGRDPTHHCDNELLLSDHIDLNSADAIARKCTVVYTFEEYCNDMFMRHRLGHKVDKDYFLSRYNYEYKTGRWGPNASTYLRQILSGEFEEGEYGAVKTTEDPLDAATGLCW